MLPVLQLGGAAIPLPPLILLASLYIALDLAQRQAVKRGLDGNQVYNLGFNSLIAALLSARLVFIVLNLDAYLAIQPTGRMLISFVTPLLGSETPLAGLIVGLLAAAYYIRRYQFNWAQVADSYAIGAAAFVIGLWLANLASGDSYGVQTSLPWGINLWGARRHPTQLYNLALSLGIFLFLWRIDPAPAAHLKKKKKKKSRQKTGGKLRVTAPYDGYTGQLFVMLTSLIILLLEPLRDDSLVIFDSIRVWQLGALVVLLASLAVFAWQAPTQRNKRTTA